MGLETAVAIGAGSSILGAGLQYGENRAARKRADKASTTAMNIASQPINVGQDSFLQQLRANPALLDPYTFDSSKAFEGLRAQDLIDTQDAVSGLRSSAGSLGRRFGSGFASKEALLRSRLAASTGARNAGIAQSSFNTALNLGVNEHSQLLGLMQQGIFQQRAQQLQALGFSTNQQVPSTGALVSQTGGDIGSLLTLMSLLNKKPAAGVGGSVSVPTPTQTYYSGGWPG